MYCVVQYEPPESDRALNAFFLHILFFFSWKKRESCVVGEDSNYQTPPVDWECKSGEVTHVSYFQPDESFWASPEIEIRHFSAQTLQILADPCRLQEMESASKTTPKCGRSKVLLSAAITTFSLVEWEVSLVAAIRDPLPALAAPPGLQAVQSNPSFFSLSR